MQALFSAAARRFATTEQFTENDGANRCLTAKNARQIYAVAKVDVYLVQRYQLRVVPR